MESLAPPSHPGTDIPDHRGRTGLDHVGMDLHRNPDVAVRTVEVTSDGWHVLRRTTFDFRDRRGNWSTQQRETYDRGNGAVILLYNVESRTVLLGRQFRYPAYVNDHPDGMLIECAAGLLEGDDPESAIRREAEEELGVTVGAVTPVFESYMSPGSVTERLHFFAAPYTPVDRRTDGGGLTEEGEDIEVLELGIDEAHRMIRAGEITDGKTIMLIQWALLDGPFRADGPERKEPPKSVGTNRLPLYTDRVEIDLLTTVDVPAFVAYRQDPGVARYQSWDVDYDEQRAHRLVSDQDSLAGGDGLPPAGDWVQLAVRDKQSRELLGDVAVHRLDDQPDTYEIGFTLAPAAQGRGLAVEALRRVLDHLFRSAGAHRVVASCDARNEASRRVLGRSGFNQEARHIDADYFKGEWTTLDEFALLASEYETIAGIGGAQTSAGRA